MRRIQLAFYLGLALAISPPTLFYTHREAMPLALAGILIAVLWARTFQNGSNSSNSLLFFVFILWLLPVLSLGAPTILDLVSLICGLVAWDLSSFMAQWLIYQPQKRQVGAEATHFIQAHLIRLAWVAGSGLIFGSLALFIRIQLGFGLAVVLVLTTFLGIAQGVRIYRR